MSGSVSNYPEEFALIKREVDSGLDETDSHRSFSGESSSLSGDGGVDPVTIDGSAIEEKREGVTGELDNGGRTYGDQNVDESKRDEVIVAKFPDDEMGNAVTMETERGYFKSPLELELERKLEEICASTHLSRKIQKAEMKELTAMQAKVAAEVQRTRGHWKRLYYESKAKALPLDARVQEMKVDLEKCRDEILRGMKTKVVERTKQRQPGDVSLRKRNLLLQRESGAYENSRGSKAASWAVPYFYKEDEFQRKMEERRKAKMIEEMANLRAKVERAKTKLEEKKGENDEERERLDALRKELNNLRLERGGKR